MERKLTDDDVREIRRRYDETRSLSLKNPNRVSCGDLAPQFNVSAQTIYLIVNRVTYLDVLPLYPDGVKWRRRKHRRRNKRQMARDREKIAANNATILMEIKAEHRRRAEAREKAAPPVEPI